MVAPHPVNALSNADQIVRLLAETGEMSPGEMSERLNIPRPTVYRILEGLRKIGLTTEIEDAKTKLSLRWLLLADSARRGFTEWHHAPPVLEKLMKKTG